VPKVVDHSARRRLIADALLHIAAERGIESVSLRQVAAAAGVSTGMVQHYFRTKDEMMAFAIEVVQNSVRSRLESSARDARPEASPATFLRSLLHELLPRDRRRRDEARVMLAFLAYASVRPAAARGMRKDTKSLLNILTEGIASAQRQGRLRADADPADAARSFLALIDGLGLHVLFGYYDSDEAMAAFDAYVSHLAPPQPGRTA
jgi:AcrR family transcriptional regulator